MAKQKMVVKVSMDDPKKRTKALKIAVGFAGVISTSVEGDRIVLVADGVDSVTLTTMLRKRMGYAELISVAPVEGKKEEKKEEKKETEWKSIQPVPLPYHNFVVAPPYPYVVQDYNHQDDSCAIM